MASQERLGRNAFERLQERLEHERRRCPACGYEEVGNWDVDTNGDRVRYRHRCSSCGNIETRVIHF